MHLVQLPFLFPRGAATVEETQDNGFIFKYCTDHKLFALRNNALQKEA